jgi:hypothetical protein
VDLGHRREVEPEYRVRRDQDRHRLGQLAGQHRPLHVAARQRRDRGIRPLGLHVELGDPSLGLAHYGAMAEPRASGQRARSKFRRTMFSAMLMAGTHALRRGSSGRLKAR